MPRPSRNAPFIVSGYPSASSPIAVCGLLPLDNRSFRIVATLLVSLLCSCLCTLRSHLSKQAKISSVGWYSSGVLSLVVICFSCKFPDRVGEVTLGLPICGSFSSPNHFSLQPLRKVRGQDWFGRTPALALVLKKCRALSCLV